MVDRWSRVVCLCSTLLFLLFGFTIEQQFLISKEDRQSLLELRSSLGLRAKEWPIKSDPCSTWVGIQCTNGSVASINISRFKRTRRGSQNPQFSIDAIRNLTLLSSFNASNFALPGPIPEWLGLQVASLRLLDLRSCSINGSIPSTLGNLSSLVELYLSGNSLNGALPSSLGQLVGLSVLDLSRNSLRGMIPVSFGDLRNLTVLDISSNLLYDEIRLGIGTLSKLRFLNLSRNGLSSSIPSQLGNLSGLVELDLGFNSLMGSIPPDLSGLRSLERLIVENNLLSGQLPDNLFPPLTRLKFLVLGRNSFTGGFPDLLWSIPSLLFLDVSVNNFTGTLPTNGSSRVKTGSVVYNISHNLFYGNITPVIKGFGFIDLSGNYFEGPIPIYARGNTSLSTNCLQNVTTQRSLTECTSFYADRNLVFDNFGEPNAERPSSPPKSDKKSHKAIILASVFGGLGLIAFVLFTVMLFIICKRKRGSNNQRGISVGPVPVGGSPLPPVSSLNFSNLGDAFTYQQILQATGEFNDANLIKHGHSGDLFRGILEGGGIPIVIKKVDLDSSVKKESYMSELDLFSKVSHPRLVPLLGHFLDNENEKFLVYKFMPNGDLSSSLFKKTDPENGLQSLDWITRLKIAIGAAEGLSYLHHECIPPLVHRDIQASSILLDDKFEVRLGSLSEVCAQEGESHQNRITRLLRLPQTSDSGASGMPNAICAYDVYCFGKVLLELVTGKLGISSSSDAATKEWLETTLPYISIYDKELVTNILDPSLIIDEDLLEEVWAMAIVARSCLNPKPTRRPLMRYILKALENPLKVVREDNTGSERLRTTSSRGSWNATLFGSWRHSSSDVANVPGGGSQIVEGMSSLKPSATTGSQGSGVNGEGNGNGNSSSAG